MGLGRPAIWAFALGFGIWNWNWTGKVSGIIDIVFASDCGCRERR
jgi:hypothetical protein